MTTDELLEMAVKAHRDKDLDYAGELYGAILSLVPDHPDALHFLGMLVHQQGESENGAGLIEKSLSINPNQPSALNNLGNIYRLLGHDEDALRAYWTAVNLDPGHADAWSNMAVIYRNDNKPAMAEKVLKIALTFSPDDHAARHYMVLVYLDLRNFEVAEEIALSLIRDDKYKGNIPVLYASALDYLGKPEEALRILLEWQKKDPANPVIEHQVRAQRGDHSPGASETYIRQTFDDFAESFEGVLQGLGYNAPAMLAETVFDRFPDRAFAQAVDLGCGTGLLGRLLKPRVDHLEGVDLSPNMLKRAAVKQVYDRLAESEIGAYLRSGAAARYDLITAAEVLNYVGDLTSIFHAAARSLKPGGLFIATYEILEGAPDPGYRLLSSGRYGHDIDYIRAVAARSGLDHVETTRIPLRKHFNDLVEGLMVLFTRAGPPPH